MGRVGWRVYAEYFGAWGPRGLLPALVLAAFLGCQSVKVGSDTWLAEWTEAVRAGTATVGVYLVRGRGWGWGWGGGA